MTTGERLGQAVRRAITRAGTTQKAVADYTGLSYSAVSLLANGKRDNPTLGVLIGVARATGSTVAKLVKDLEK